MKNFLLKLLVVMLCGSASAQVQVKEKLNRAPVAVKTSQGILVSWRYLEADGYTKFSVYRNGLLVKDGIDNVTNYLDAEGKPGDIYKVESNNGDEATCTAWDNMFTKISIPRPAPRVSKDGSLVGEYRPDDISVGDVDGDGDYELIVKWLPNNQRDSDEDGYTSATYIDCYEMDGTQKWRIDLGDGVRSGQHTTPFLVYDFDGDGKAEVILKTAPDSKDGVGNYVTQAGNYIIKAIEPSTVTVNSEGRVTQGAEFLTVFNGETGAAMHTIFYSPSRSMADFPNGDTSYSSSWGDNSYNRGERYNAAVAYLEGKNYLPSAILQRGYMTACYIWAVDWNGRNLKTRWLHKGTSKTAWSLIDFAFTELANETTDPVLSQGKSSYGQGVHGISIGDVDLDGRDDICIGAATISHDGKLLCSTDFGHGDVLHLADLCPDRPGLEVMMPHAQSPFGWDVHDAKTGEVLFSANSDDANGNGLACDFIPGKRGSEFWSSADNIVRSCVDGTAVSEKKPDNSFRIYWTGDPFDQTFDGKYDEVNGCSPRICSWDTQKNAVITFQEFADYNMPQTCNNAKATPCLQADLLGDWREEIIMTNYETDWSAPTCDLLIYSTPEPTDYMVPCLMEDHLYRMAVASQNSSYNLPPHLGFCLPDYLGVDGNSYNTQTTNHAPAKVYTIDATSDYDYNKEGEGDVIFNRTFQEGDYNTLVLPFNMTEAEVYSVFGQGTEIFYAEVFANNNISLKTATEGNVIKANTPCVIFINNVPSVPSYNIPARTIVPSTTANPSYAGTDITSIGNYAAAYQIPISGMSNWFIGYNGMDEMGEPHTEGRLYYVDSEVRLKNTQAYFSVVGATETKGIGMTINGETTGIVSVENGTLNFHAGKAYDLTGREVKHPAKGIYIVNGKKVIIK